MDSVYQSIEIYLCLEFQTTNQLIMHIAYTIRYLRFKAL